MHRRTWGTAALLGILVLVLPGCRPNPSPLPATFRGTLGPVREDRTEPPEPLSRLLSLMRDRLLLMHDVARSKWNSRRPLSDEQRERALLAEMETLGKEHGLAPRFTHAFFVAQISAAKYIQQQDFARWQTAGHAPFGPAPDLTALRRRIDELNRQMLSALSQSGSWPVTSRERERIRDCARHALVGEGIDDTVRAAAITPLITDP